MVIQQLESTIEKPQIRHGRSRGHYTRTKSTTKDVEHYPNNPETIKPSDNIKDNSYGLLNNNQKLSRSTNDTFSEFDIDESTSTNYSIDPLTMNLHETLAKLKSQKYGLVVEYPNGTTSRRSSLKDSLRKLRKVAVSSSDKVTKRDRNTSRSSLDIYGSVSHGRMADDNFDDILKFEDYIYDDELIKNITSVDTESVKIDNYRTSRFGNPGAHDDVVSRFLRIIENQHLLGENCTAGTDLNLGEGVVDQYAQERFRLEANLAVNRANMLTRLWKYAPEVMMSSEYLLHASILSMVEFDEDIFAAGNCYDKMQYRERWLYCPFAHRLQNEDGILVKDLAIEYKYLSNSSEWFYIARKNAERVIANNNQFSRGKFIIFFFMAL
uniref:Uncharacterized protein n=1 Tax=Bracon brevicornis TaxID=1563983 RepID=A0A6V7KVG3_9HYME